MTTRAPGSFPILLASIALAIGACEGSGTTTTPPPAAAFSLADFESPPIEYRPWVRWWWPGNDVQDSEIAREVQLLADSFFGGAEIQAFDAALDPNAPRDEIDRRLSFDTESFYGHLAAVMEAARSAGITIDLTLGSGWPSGGMHVPPNRSLETLLWGELAVSGPGERTIQVPPPRRPVFYLVAAVSGTLLDEPLARYLGDAAERVAVVAARVTGGRRHPNPLVLTDSVTLDPASTVVLTDRVDASGSFDWTVPEGEWLVVGIYRAPDGEYPILVAEPEPGYVVDHLDRAALLEHLDHLLGPRTGLAPYAGSPLRAFFNDSFEFKAERHFTPDLLGAFRGRRGYDLAAYFPAVLVPGADNFFLDSPGITREAEYSFSPEDHRIRYDYALTVSDLFLDRFFGTCRSWAADHGLLSRVQAHGLGIDLIRAAGASDIPETEQLYAGGSEMFLKIASSGAHLHGRAITSAESLVWMTRDHMTTPLKIKAAADKLFTSGVNQVLYHGFPYAKNHDYGETGWNPFSSPFAGPLSFSSHIAETDPFWKYLPAVNRYVARCQYALRQGRPEVDLLVYYPWLGLPASFTLLPDHDEFLFNGYLAGHEPPPEPNPLVEIGNLLGLTGVDPRSAWLASLWPRLADLESRGYTWEWVNDESLAAARADGRGGIAIRGNRYAGLVVPEVASMQPAAASSLATASEKGAAVVFLGEPPAAQPGFHDYAKGDAFVREAMARIIASPRARKLGEAGSAAEALSAIGVEPGIRFTRKAEPIRHIRRRLAESSQIVFLRNPEGSTRDLALAVTGGCEDTRLFDAWNGATSRAAAGDSGEIALSLAAYGSIWLLCGIAEPPPPEGLAAAGASIAPVPASSRRHPSAAARPLDSWKLTVAGEDVPGGSVSLDLDRLADWREIESLRFSSSHGLYTAEVALDEADAGEAIELDLGWLYGAAEVRVNGREAGTLLVPPYRLGVTGLLAAGRNRIEVEIVPALRNRLVGKARSGDPRYTQFRGKEATLLPGGLIGPAVLEVGTALPTPGPAN